MAINRVDVKPELLRWACERAGDAEGAIREKFANLDAWIRGDMKPTLEQLEEFARAAGVAIGYLFLPHLPEEGPAGGQAGRALAPDIPAELWMVWEPAWGDWADADDRMADGPTYLVFFDEPAARAAADHINEVYQYHCVPVRVK